METPLKLALFVFSHFVSFSGYALELIGTAKHIKTGEVLYIEKHEIASDEKGLNRMIQTEYQKPDGKVFASMKTDFQEDPFLPKIDFADSRFSFLETQVYDKKLKKLTLVKSENGKEISRKSLDVVDNMVSGQGFTNFIKVNFDAPEKSHIKFNFVVLAKMDFYQFDILVKGSEDKNAKKFQLSPGHLIFRLFLKPIEVSYDAKTKRILTYLGLSNIMTDEHKSQEVLITYAEGRP